jgi:hypothetical protein
MTAAPAAIAAVEPESAAAGRGAANEVAISAAAATPATRSREDFTNTFISYPQTLAARLRRFSGYPLIGRAATVQRLRRTNLRGSPFVLNIGCATLIATASPEHIKMDALEPQTWPPRYEVVSLAHQGDQTTFEKQAPRSAERADERGEDEAHRHHDVDPHRAEQQARRAAQLLLFQTTLG